MIDVHALIHALGYLHSGRHWVTPENADARLTYHYRLAQRAGEKIGPGGRIVGAYVYETSLDDKTTPPRPAVFVAEAANEEQARTIHKRLWNLGDCPFIVIVLPGVIRVYSGFDYDAKDPRRGLVTSASAFQEALPDPLKPFGADAIDSGNLWREQAKYLGSDTRVDYRLLTHLKELSRLLQERYALSREGAHALIGKYIYFRYLRDRGILDDEWLDSQGIRPENVFRNEATAAGFLSLAQALQTRFNGDIFPLPVEANDQWKENGAVPFLVGVFNGNDPGGQLALDFQVYDFSYIPIELLSSIYEQFLKAEGRGGEDGVVYTPEALADYVLAELESVHSLCLGHKVLDPCCGSGVFLVLSYRRLIEKLWEQENTHPSAEALKALLTTSIFGVEKDAEACHITAFSLILTLLSYLEPPELHANVGFQFPTLIGENIYQSDFFAPDCPVFQKAYLFDWVVGNPPWSSADTRNPSHRPALTWMRDAEKAGQNVGDLRLDEAFTWRAGDLLQGGGTAALLIKATTLVNSSSANYRKSFFKAHIVRRITNLSNLRYQLFMGPEGTRAKAPTVCLVYDKASPEEHKPVIRHFGPFVANQIPLKTRTRSGRQRVWTITLYESDIQEVDHGDAEEDVPCLWKTALWGTHQDRRALRRLHQLLSVPLGDYAQQRGWSLDKGLEFYRGRAKTTEGFAPAPELAGKFQFIAEYAGRFTADDIAIIPITPSQQFIRRRSGAKGLSLIPAPHLVITAEGALYSDVDFVIPSPKVGIATPRENAAELKAVALYLNSSIARYLYFFYNPPWGIYIYASTKDSVSAIPFTELTDEQIVALSTAYDRFAEREREHRSADAPLLSEPLEQQADVDAVVEAVLGVPDSIGTVAREFMQVRFQLIEGKTGASASATPSNNALRRYAEQIQRHIDDFARRRHRVTVLAGREAIIATIEVTNEKEKLPVSITTEWNTSAISILAAVQEQHSQWAYIQRSVRIFDGPRVHIVKAARLLDWTQTQAIEDASDLISEVLDKTSRPHEPATT